MNNTRRKQITKLAERLSGLISNLEDVQSEIESIRDEEQDYLDNMPESMQDSDKGMNAQEVIDALEEAAESVSELVDGEVLAQLERAAE